MTILTDKIINLLIEIVEAGTYTLTKLDMATWHTGITCCLSGDVAEQRLLGDVNQRPLPFSNSDDMQQALSDEAILFEEYLRLYCEELFGSDALVQSVLSSDIDERRGWAFDTGLLTVKQLYHPHLATDHNDREIVHDYILSVVLPMVEARDGY